MFSVVGKNKNTTATKAQFYSKVNAKSCCWSAVLAALEPGFSILPEHSVTRPKLAQDADTITHTHTHMPWHTDTERKLHSIKRCIDVRLLFGDLHVASPRRANTGENSLWVTVARLHRSPAVSREEAQSCCRESEFLSAFAWWFYAKFLLLLFGCLPLTHKGS